MNFALQEKLKEQHQQHHDEIKAEKLLTANNLTCGFCHEICTPVGVALTAISISVDKLKLLVEDFNSGNLTRTSFIKRATEISEAIQLNKMNLSKTSQLIERFKEVNSFTSSKEKSTFFIDQPLGSLHLSIFHFLESHSLSIKSGAIELTCHKHSLWELLNILIENSIIHGFENSEEGQIHINVTLTANDNIVINYQGNDCGILKENKSKIFDHFYTSARHNKHLGLGLSLLSNIVSHKLNGRIRLVESPIGIRYEIIIPRK